MTSQDNQRLLVDNDAEMDSNTRKRLSSYSGYFHASEATWGSEYAGRRGLTSSFSGVTPIGSRGGSLVAQMAVPEEGRKAGVCATMFNVINIYVGLGLLAQPYALQRGGWVVLVFMGLCGLMCAYTGKLVVKCFANMDMTEYMSRGGATWSNLADYLIGPYGQAVVVPTPARSSPALNPNMRQSSNQPLWSSNGQSVIVLVASNNRRYLPLCMLSYVNVGSNCAELGLLGWLGLEDFWKGLGQGLFYGTTV